MTSSSPLNLIFIPFVTPGHIVPLSEIACLFAARGETVTIITTPDKVPVVEKITNKFISSAYSIYVHPIAFPHNEVGLPEGFTIEQATDITTATKYYQCLQLMQRATEDYILTCHPDCIIADKFFPWTSDFATRLNVPRLVFEPCSVFSRCMDEALLDPNSPHHTVVSDDDQFVIPGLPHSITMTRSKLPDTDRVNLFKLFREAELKSYGCIFNSFPELDLVYAEFYTKRTGKKAFEIGPTLVIDASDKVDRSLTSSDEYNCLNWLNSKKPNSVIYICFGTGFVIPDVQLMEIASALESANYDFIWVVRGKDKDDDDETTWLPPGFCERTTKKGKGMILKRWAPQALILEHPSTGGFVTHCGWNSSMEAIVMGVPVATWPFIADNFYNENFLSQVLRIGVEIGAEDLKLFHEVGKKVIKRETIVDALRKLMDGGDEAQEMRRKVKELQRAVKEGESSHKNLTVLIEELKQLREKRFSCGNF